MCILVLCYNIKSQPKKVSIMSKSTKSKYEEGSLSELRTAELVAQVKDIVRPLRADNAELVITEAFFEVITQLHHIYGGEDYTQMHDRLVMAFEVWWLQVKPHIHGLNRAN